MWREKQLLFRTLATRLSFNKKPPDNVQFGKMAGFVSSEVLLIIYAVVWLVQEAVKPATSTSCRPVSCSLFYSVINKSP